jgi:hypothetical protein
MLASQLTAAAAAARNTHAVDQLARLTWRAHAEGHLADAEAEAIGVALQARRRAFGQAGPSRHRGLPLGFLWPPGARLDRPIDRRASSAAAGRL